MIITFESEMISFHLKILLKNPNIFNTNLIDTLSLSVRLIVVVNILNIGSKIALHKLNESDIKLVSSQ